MSSGFTQQELKKYIDRMTEWLPKTIIVHGKKLYLSMKYMGVSDDRWTLTYGTEDPRDCFIHRDESSLELCLLGAWRNLALKKDEWHFNTEMANNTEEQ